MSDAERKQGLLLLTELYGAVDQHEAIAHMPTEMNDPEADEYGDYFDFLQLLYDFRGSFMTMDEAEVQDTYNKLMLVAKRFHYPTNQIEAFSNV